MIETKLLQTNPNVILVAFTGRVSFDDVTTDRQFGQYIKILHGASFRVIGDFTATTTMPEEVGAVFMKAQSFAAARGMERDAFVCSSAALRLQLTRLARESGRADALGPMRFFATLEEALAQIVR